MASENSTFVKLVLERVDLTLVLLEIVMWICLSCTHTHSSIQDGVLPQLA